MAGAITSATAATVAVFLPLGLVGGQVGELFRPFAFTVAIAMLASLFVALTIIPVLGYWFLRPQRRGVGLGRSSAPTGPTACSGPTCRCSAAPWHTPCSPSPWPGSSWSPPVSAATQLKTDFIGSSGENTLTVTLEMPTGTTLDDTDAAAQEVEAWLAGRADVESYQVVVGSSGGFETIFLGGGGSTATFAVSLDEGTDGDVFGEELQAQIPEPEGGRLAVAGSTQQPGASNLEVIVSAADPDDLAAAAADVVEAVQAAGGTDVSNNLADTALSLRVTVDREAAAEAGLTETQVGQVVSAVSTGSTVGQVDLGADILPVAGRAG